MGLFKDRLKLKISIHIYTFWLSPQVHSLEVELGRREGLQERLGEELRGLSSRLGSQEEENSSLVGRLEATLRKLEFSEQEKNVLQVIRKKYIM